MSTATLCLCATVFKRPGQGFPFWAGPPRSNACTNATVFRSSSHSHVGGRTIEERGAGVLPTTFLLLLIDLSFVLHGPPSPKDLVELNDG